MRKLLGTVAAATVAVGITAGSAPGHPPPHRHCLLTPQGHVEIGQGVLEQADHDPAFHNLHFKVHAGAPPTTIKPLFDLNAGCETLD